MAFGEKALRMDRQLAVPALAHDCLHGRGGFALESTAWGNNRDAHRQAYGCATRTNAI
jgi:hypothetical protein